MLVTRTAGGVYQRAVLPLLRPATFALLALALSSCGGSGTSGPGAKGPKDKASKTDGNGEGEDAESGEAESTPAASRCADGSCFECGAGLCPKGFYCDEKAGGGPACAWLPECASNTGCACVKAGLGGGCSCEERSGGTFVKCD